VTASTRRWEIGDSTFKWSTYPRTLRQR